MKQFIDDYSNEHFLSDVQSTAVKCIVNCRTASMGAHVSECRECYAKYVHYNSCKNRHCPMCQGIETNEWIDKRQEDVLEASYYHTVFTVPSELYPLIYSNQKLLYNLMYNAASRTLSELSADNKYLGVKIGYICVLHTWGSKLNYHPHIHTIILGGGLDKNNHWKDKDGKYLFPVRVMSELFKKYFLKELKMLWKNDKLEYKGNSADLHNYYSFKEMLDRLYSKKWVVYIKETFNGAMSVIKYLGNYTHRSAISNKRIISYDDENVTFMAKNYKHKGRYEPETIKGTVFIRRFLMHILPKGFVRIRYYGLLSCRTKTEKMTLCRNLLGCKQYISKLRNKSMPEKLKILFDVDVCKCRNCGAELSTYKIPGIYMLC